MSAAEPCDAPWHAKQDGRPCPSCKANPCAWCGPKLPGVSHGICPSCFRAQLAEIEREGPSTPASETIENKTLARG